MNFSIKGRMTPKNKKMLARELWVCHEIIKEMSLLIEKNTSEKYLQKFYDHIIDLIDQEELINEDDFVVDMEEFTDKSKEKNDIAQLVLEESSGEESELAIKFFKDALDKYDGDTLKAFEESALKIDEVLNKKEKNVVEEDAESIFNPKKVWDMTDLLLELDPDGGEF